MSSQTAVNRVLIIGGYGNFGSYITRRLAEVDGLQVIIAGRSPAKATAFAKALTAKEPPLVAELDITRNLQETLAQLEPDVVVHTSGPFQGQDSFVAQCCIEAGCHYIDLADGRDFVVNIDQLNDAALAKDVTVVSGASSVPCLSASLLDHYQDRFSEMQSLDYGITTAQKTNRGVATTEAILSYAGKPFQTLLNGQMHAIFGWQDLHRHDFKELGPRWLGNCDIPDLSLFPRRYPSLQSIRFSAGLELPFLHFALWGLTWLVRWRLLPSLKAGARFMLKCSFLFDALGSDESAFYLRIKGLDSAEQDKELTFDLTARSGDGPYIPCIPAIVLARKLVQGDDLPKGAMSSIGLLSLEEYLKALSPLDITWQVSEH